ncbi:carboxypeptidase-like regulatory domain-containing protein [Chloroflexota bacterium]
MLPITAYAHGAAIDISTDVTITATYDNGEPMSGAQVTIHAPDDAVNPWDDPGTGICDADGRYSFTPDPDIPGRWRVQVSKAGHGDDTYLDVVGGGGLSVLQIVLMSVCVAWGFVGTALYFRRKRSA